MNKNLVYIMNEGNKQLQQLATNYFVKTERRSIKGWEKILKPRTGESWEDAKNRIISEMYLNGDINSYSKEQKIANEYLKGPRSSGQRLKRIIEQVESDFQKKRNSFINYTVGGGTFYNQARRYLERGYFVDVSRKKRDETGREYIEVLEFVPGNNSDEYKNAIKNGRFTIGNANVKSKDLFNILSGKIKGTEINSKLTDGAISNFVKGLKKITKKVPIDKIFTKYQFVRPIKGTWMRFLPQMFDSILWFMFSPLRIYKQRSIKSIKERFWKINDLMNELVLNKKTNNNKENLKNEVINLYYDIYKLNDKHKEVLNDFISQIDMNETKDNKNKYELIKDRTQHLKKEQKKPKAAHIHRCVFDLKRIYPSLNTVDKSILNKIITENSYKTMKHQIFGLCKKYKLQ